MSAGNRYTAHDSSSSTYWYTIYTRVVNIKSVPLLFGSNKKKFRFFLALIFFLSPSPFCLTSCQIQTLSTSQTHNDDNKKNRLILYENV